jgi:hypothetical protein
MGWALAERRSIRRWERVISFNARSASALRSLAAAHPSLPSSVRQAPKPAAFLWPRQRGPPLRSFSAGPIHPSLHPSGADPTSTRSPGAARPIHVTHDPAPRAPGPDPCVALEKQKTEQPTRFERTMHVSAALPAADPAAAASHFSESPAGCLGPARPGPPQLALWRRGRRPAAAGAAAGAGAGTGAGAGAGRRRAGVVVGGGGPPAAGRPAKNRGEKGRGHIIYIYIYIYI